MRVKFNKFERVAGVFVLFALIGSLIATAGIAVQKGWFASKVNYSTILDNAEGIHSGTTVQIAGLRAGTVLDVELITGSQVKVRFEVFEKFRSRIKTDSRIQVVRPFIIGKKVFDITVGSENEEVLKANSLIASQANFDLMDLFSGRKLAPFLGTIDALASNLQVLAEAFADEKRMKNFVAMFDKMTPLINNMNLMSKKIIGVSDIVTRKKRLVKMVDNVIVLTNELNKVLPDMNEQHPNFGNDVALLMANMSELTKEFKKLTPAIGAIAPDLPRVSKRAIEGLDELVVTLKALQKSFILRGSVEDVRKEESRKPAKD